MFVRETPKKQQSHALCEKKGFGDRFKSAARLNRLELGGLFKG
jgi:hypothetical protein